MGLFSFLFRRKTRGRELEELQAHTTLLRREIGQLEHTLAVPHTEDEGEEGSRLRRLRELVISEQIADRREELEELEQREAVLIEVRGWFGRRVRPRAVSAIVEEPAVVEALVEEA